MIKVKDWLDLIRQDEGMVEYQLMTKDKILQLFTDPKDLDEKYFDSTINKVTITGDYGDHYDLGVIVEIYLED